MHSYKKAVKRVNYRKTGQRKHQGEQSREQGAGRREEGGGRREQGHKLDNYRNKEVGSVRGRRKRLLRVL